MGQTVPATSPSTATTPGTSPSTAASETPPTTEQIAAKLLVSTVTIRVSAPLPEKTAPVDKADPANKTAPAEKSAPQTGAKTGPAPAVDPNQRIDPNQPGAKRAAPPSIAPRPAEPRGSSVEEAAVVVASGVSVGNGLIVTFVNAPASSRVRVTLPGDGESCEARVRVVDHYSGLSLLRIKKEDVPKIEMATDTPSIGAPIFTAAGAGMDQPLVSSGILGGSDRSVGHFLPPLLQCDVRTSGSSCGAAILSREGRLVGVVVATESSAERAGWTYAVPVHHVHRLIAQEPARDVDGVVILERRRPELGLVLRTENGSVQVEQVRAGGPAAQSGIQVGDLVLEVDNLKVRSVYQAVERVLRKQPGDKLALLIRRQDLQLKLDITLGNAGKAAPVTMAASPELGVGRATQIRIYGPGGIEVRELTFSGPDSSNSTPSESPAAKAEVQSKSEIELYRAQIERWSRGLQRMQEELEARDRAIRALEAKVKQLESQLPPPPAPSVPMAVPSPAPGPASTSK